MEVMEQFPVTREQVKAVLEFTARSLTHPCGSAMRVLFDGTPRGVATALTDHVVEELVATAGHVQTRENRRRRAAAGSTCSSPPTATFATNRILPLGPSRSW